MGVRFPPGAPKVKKLQLPRPPTTCGDAEVVPPLFAGNVDNSLTIMKKNPYKLLPQKIADVDDMMTEEQREINETREKNFEIEAVKKTVESLRIEARIEESSAETILDVLKRQTLIRELLHNKEGLTTLREAKTGSPEALEKLRLLCMGVWLESTSTFAINSEGGLNVDIIDGELHLSGEIAEQKNMLYRQAIIRQIERWAVMQENGLLGETDESSKTVLDVGSGTLIVSTMMRKRFPNAEITSVEPGLVSPKTVAIAEKKNIELIHGGLQEIGGTKKYDYIILHFVLEHSVKQAKDLVRESLKRLADGGEISIAVPNFDAFHREVETAIGMNQRNPETRLSQHDHFSGHQIIFTKESLIALIQEVMEEEGLSLPIHAKTILPRPFAFNTLCAMNEHKELLNLEKAGNIPYLQNNGSVLCITVGGKTEKVETQPTADNGEKTKEIFRKLISKFIKSSPDTAEQFRKKAFMAFLEERYPDLLETADIRVAA